MAMPNATSDSVNGNNPHYSLEDGGPTIYFLGGPDAVAIDSPTAKVIAILKAIAHAKKEPGELRLKGAYIGEYRSKLLRRKRKLSELLDANCSSTYQVMEEIENGMNNMTKKCRTLLKTKNDEYIHQDYGRGLTRIAHDVMVYDSQVGTSLPPITEDDDNDFEIALCQNRELIQPITSALEDIRDRLATLDELMGVINDDNSTNTRPTASIPNDSCLIPGRINGDINTLNNSYIIKDIGGSLLNNGNINITHRGDGSISRGEIDLNTLPTPPLSDELVAIFNRLRNKVDTSTSSQNTDLTL